MVNKFASRCRDCGHVVAAGAGEYVFNRGEGSVYHARGQCVRSVPVQPLRSFDRLSLPGGDSFEYDFFGNGYDSAGWSWADWRDAVNPDEGDRG